MKVYNNTKLEDAILIDVLRLAAKSVGRVRTSKVVIKITTSSRYIRGRVQKQTGFLFFEGFLEQSGHDKDGDWKNQKLVNSDGGYMFLLVPVQNTWNYPDPLHLAESIYSVAVHEWKHIKDLQKHLKFDSHKKRWKNRIQEKRAVRIQERADQTIIKHDDIQESIINLGIEIERVRETK